MLGYPEFCMKKCRACSRISKYVHEAVLIHTLCTCCPMKALKNSFDFRMQAKNLLNSITSIFTLPSLLLLRSYVYIDYEKLIMNDAWRSRKVEEATIRFANCLSFVWRGSLSLSLSLSPLTQRDTQLIAQNSWANWRRTKKNPPRFECRNSRDNVSTVSSANCGKISAINGSLRRFVPIIYMSFRLSWFYAVSITDLKFLVLLLQKHNCAVYRI